MGFLSLYIAGKLHVFDRKGYTYKGFVVAAPLIIATFIAVSRTQDYRHHWHDVVVGGFTGKFIYMIYKLFFSLEKIIDHKKILFFSRIPFVIFFISPILSRFTLTRIGYT